MTDMRKALFDSKLRVKKVRNLTTLEEPNIAEPAEAITLPPVLAYALLHDSELAVHASEMRVSEARELQASPLQNPAIEIEVEEVGGTGARSGFTAAETTLPLSQLIELGNKRFRRTRIVLLQSQLVGWDYEAKRLDVFAKAANAFVDVPAAYHKGRVEMERLIGQGIATITDIPTQ